MIDKTWGMYTNMINRSFIFMCALLFTFGVTLKNVGRDDMYLTTTNTRTNR